MAGEHEISTAPGGPHRIATAVLMAAIILAIVAAVLALRTFLAARAAKERADVQAIADESQAHVEQFLRNLPRYVNGTPLPASEAWGSQPLEPHWVEFYKKYGDFISWTRTTSPSKIEDYTMSEFGGRGFWIGLQAVFEKGTINLGIEVQLGGWTPVDGPCIASYILQNYRPGEWFLRICNSHTSAEQVKHPATRPSA